MFLLENRFGRSQSLRCQKFLSIFLSSKSRGIWCLISVTYYFRVSSLQLCSEIISKKPAISQNILRVSPVSMPSFYSASPRVVTPWLSTALGDTLRRASNMIIVILIGAVSCIQVR